MVSGARHHRVVYFVGRNAGTCVGDLLGILKITKQSLSRVLRQLLDEGFVEQRGDSDDGRKRRLYLTEKGRDLESRLTDLQGRRIAAAYRIAGAGQAREFRAVLRAIVNAEDRGRFEDIAP